MSYQTQELEELIGCTVRSLDGTVFQVESVKMRQDRPAIIGPGVFSYPGEFVVLSGPDGTLAPLLTADPIMREVFDIILARGDLTKADLELALDDEDYDANWLYQGQIAPVIDRLEKHLIARAERLRYEEAG